MPRIRGIKDLVFHRPDSNKKFTHIDRLFRTTSTGRLIETHLPDMLRVAVSIKLGKISASAILRRLGTYSRKNKLYFAFKELGKVIRTMFLLKYVGDVELRRLIHAETNKSEQFNGFEKKLFFGGEGEIAENLRHEQRKIIKYNHLVANLVILHNVVGMSRVLKQLQAEGAVINQEVLAGWRHTGWSTSIVSAITCWISDARSRRWMRGSEFWRLNQQANSMTIEFLEESQYHGLPCACVVTLGRCS
jgi:TnpA family transposase